MLVIKVLNGNPEHDGKEFDSFVDAMDFIFSVESYSHPEDYKDDYKVIKKCDYN